MSDQSNKKLIVDEREALSAYFNALLSEEGALPNPEAQPILAEAEAQVIYAEPEPAVLIAPPEITVAEVAPVIEKAPEPEQAPEPAPGPVSELPRVPAWGEEKFQVMLFKVSGLALAVPLAELNGVQEWFPESVTPMPGHAPWYLGLVNYRDRQVPVIDTARFVMPADRQDMVSEDINERLNRIVYIGEASWGLACDEVAEVITIEPDQVRWRSNRTKRRWLAGTVIEQMCALIDPPVFAEMLAQGMGTDDIGL